MNFYQTIAKNLYTDNTVTTDGTVYGIREYIDIMQGTRNLRTYFSNLLLYMSSEEVAMYRELKPALSRLVYKYCHSRLTEPPGDKVKEQNKIHAPVDKTLSQDQIALICVYDKKSLEEYCGGVPSKKQQGKYNLFTSRQKRTGLEPVAANGSRQASYNKLKKIESVIPFLTTEAGVEAANKDARALKLSIENDISES